MPLSPEDRERIEREHKQLQKELAKEREHGDAARKAATDVRMEAAKARRAAIRARLKKLSLADLIKTDVHCVVYDRDGGHPSVCFAIRGSGGQNSEEVLTRFLDRLEALLGAVPGLLATAQAAVNMVEWLKATHPAVYNGADDEFLEAARAAIAKATGV